MAKIAPRFVCNFSVPFEWASAFTRGAVSISRFFPKGMLNASNAWSIRRWQSAKWRAISFVRSLAASFARSRLATPS